MTAAHLAGDEGIKIYPIGIGADPQESNGKGMFSINPGVDLDEPALEEIAKITGGQYFRARDGGELSAIKDTLDQLEPVAQQPSEARPAHALYSWPLAVALLLSVLLVIRELWPNNPVQRWLSKGIFCSNTLTGAHGSNACACVDADERTLATLVSSRMAAGPAAARLAAMEALAPGKARRSLYPCRSPSIAYCSAAAMAATAGCRGLPSGSAGYWQCWPCSAPAGNGLSSPHKTRRPAGGHARADPEMLATDSSPNRLEQARRKLYDLLQNRSDAQTAVIVYAGSAHTLVPLSDGWPPAATCPGPQAINHATGPSAQTWRLPRPWPCSIRAPWARVACC